MLMLTRMADRLLDYCSMALLARDNLYSSVRLSDHVSLQVCIFAVYFNCVGKIVL